jgi:hypothetical protein
VEEFRDIALSLVAWPGLCWAACLVSRRLVPPWTAAEAATTHNRPQDSPQDDPQESARPAFLLAGACQRGPGGLLLPLPAAGSGRAWSRGSAETLTVADVWWRGVAGVAGPAYCWGQDWFRPVPVAAADRLVGPGW